MQFDVIAIGHDMQEPWKKKISDDNDVQYDMVIDGKGRKRLQ